MHGDNILPFVAWGRYRPDLSLGAAGCHTGPRNGSTASAACNETDLCHASGALVWGPAWAYSTNITTSLIYDYTTKCWGINMFSLDEYWVKNIHINIHNTHDNKVHSKNYAYGVYLALFAHILQGYFNKTSITNSNSLSNLQLIGHVFRRFSNKIKFSSCWPSMCAKLPRRWLLRIGRN